MRPVVSGRAPGHSGSRGHVQYIPVWPTGVLASDHRKAESARPVFAAGARHLNRTFRVPAGGAGLIGAAIIWLWPDACHASSYGRRKEHQGERGGAGPPGCSGGWKQHHDPQSRRELRPGADRPGRSSRSGPRRPAPNSPRPWGTTPSTEAESKARTLLERLGRAGAWQSCSGGDRGGLGPHGRHRAARSGGSVQRGRRRVLHPGLLTPGAYEGTGVRAVHPGQ